MTRFRSKLPLLAAGYSSAAAANALPSIVIGRTLGAGSLGAYALALSVARIFYAATDMGAASHLTRAASRDRDTSSRLVSAFLRFRATLVPLACALGIAVGCMDETSAPWLFALIAAGQGAVSLQLLLEATLLGHERQKAVAALTAATSITTALGCGLWLMLRLDFQSFGLTYAIAAYLSLGMWIIAARRHQRQQRPSAAPQFVWQTVRTEFMRSWPIGASTLFGIAALRVPVIVLGAAGNAAQIGEYSAVDMFVTAAGILQAAVTSATFPSLAASFGRDPTQFSRLFWQSNLTLAVIGLFISIGLVLFGSAAASYVFPGKDFSNFDMLMQVVGWSVTPLLLVHHNINLFAAADQERNNVRVMGAWFAITALFQCVLVPLFGLAGAAWGVLIARTVGLIALAAVIRAVGIHRGGALEK